MTVVTEQGVVVLDLVAVRRFSEAVAALGSDWPGLAVEPGSDCAPEMLFCVGVLNTHLGFAEQNALAQEVAKNCLSRASRAFKGDNKDLCDLQLALSYWRAGDEEESLIQILELRDRGLCGENLFRTVYAGAVVLGSLGRHKEASEWLGQARETLDHASTAFCGKFHTEVAFNLMHLGGDYVLPCLDALTDALACFDECGADASKAIVHNNLAAVYKDALKFDRAHDHVERAIGIGTKLGDKSIVSQCYDLQAQIFLDQGQPTRAAQCAHESIRLATGAGCGWTIDSRITYGKALARSNDPRAVEEFSAAIHLARRQENRYKETEAALTALEETDLERTLMLEWLPLAERSDERKRVTAVRRKVANNLIAACDYEDVRIAMVEHKGNIHHAAKSLGYNSHTGLLPFLNKHPELRLKKPYKRTKR